MLIPVPSPSLSPGPQPMSLHQWCTMPGYLVVNLGYCITSLVMYVITKVESRVSRGSEKYEITLRIIFSCEYTDSSRFLAMFNDVLTYGAPSVNLLFSANNVTISLIYLVISNNQITGRGASWLYQITRLLTMAHFGYIK